MTTTGKLGPQQRAVPDEILPGLFLGDEKDAFSAASCARFRITHVVSVVAVDPAPYRRLLPVTVREHMVVPVLDEKDADLRPYFSQTNAFIARGRREGRVLVHCVCGVSRSATVVVAYLLATQHLDYSEAMRLVIDRRSCAYPNRSFRNQLRHYWRELVDVEFKVHYNTEYGQQLHLVGSLDGWQPTSHNVMQWTGDGWWNIVLPARGVRFEYKYLVADRYGRVIKWEPINNRVFYSSESRFNRDTWACRAQTEVAHGPDASSSFASAP
eukprot:TRINITY_DN18788_c0_g1_i1.p1 TRINITY_DN18788_c0_g1~~TRINITY_DN18788_c0_g1_i1.p1  ORF type:complete len:307 (-),score=83.33 TRINITY_DN18788_c0_g1_i1:136-942(-)